MMRHLFIGYKSGKSSETFSIGILLLKLKLKLLLLNVQKRKTFFQRKMTYFKDKQPKT